MYIEDYFWTWQEVDLKAKLYNRNKIITWNDLPETLVENLPAGIMICYQASPIAAAMWSEAEQNFSIVETEELIKTGQHAFFSENAAVSEAGTTIRNAVKKFAQKHPKHPWEKICT